MRAKNPSRPMCGFCMTGHHENCKAEIKYYDKIWYCDCTKCHPDREEEVEETCEQEEKDSNS